jgi:hypothetical protein
MVGCVQQLQQERHLKEDDIWLHNGGERLAASYAEEK